MNTKVVSQLDSNGYYVRPTEADESPLEPGVWLIPGKAVDVPPPDVPEGFRAKWDGSTFVMEELPPPEPEPTPPTLLERQNAVWENAKRYRNFHEFYGGVQVSGHWFHTDQESQLKYIRLEAKALRLVAEGGLETDVLTTLGQPVSWKTLDNGAVPMTAGLAIQVAAATEILSALCHARSQALNAEIFASEDPESIDLEAGWPAKYSDYPWYEPTEEI